MFPAPTPGPTGLRAARGHKGSLGGQSPLVHAKSPGFSGGPPSGWTVLSKLPPAPGAGGKWQMHSHPPRSLESSLYYGDMPSLPVPSELERSHGEGACQPSGEVLVAHPPSFSRISPVCSQTRTVKRYQNSGRHLDVSVHDSFSGFRVLEQVRPTWVSGAGPAVSHCPLWVSPPQFLRCRVPSWEVPRTLPPHLAPRRAWGLGRDLPQPQRCVHDPAIKEALDKS